MGGGRLQRRQAGGGAVAAAHRLGRHHGRFKAAAIPVHAASGARAVESHGRGGSQHAPRRLQWLERPVLCDLAHRQERGGRAEHREEDQLHSQHAQPRVEGAVHDRQGRRPALGRRRPTGSERLQYGGEARAARFGARAAWPVLHVAGVHDRVGRGGPLVPHRGAHCVPRSTASCGTTARRRSAC